MKPPFNAVDNMKAILAKQDLHMQKMEQKYFS